MLYVVLFEIAAMAVLFFGDNEAILYFSVIVFVPILLLFIPIEPLLGLPLMFIATGFDFFAQITRDDAELFNFTYFHIVMFITFLSVFMKSCTNRKLSIPSIPLWPPLIAFMIVMLISTIYTPYFMLGFMEFVRLVVLAFLSFALIISIDSKKKVKFVVWSYVLIPLSVALFTIYEILTEGAFFSSQVSRVATELGIAVYRSTGTFHNPNQLACFLMIGITLSFSVLIIEKTSIFFKVIMFIIIGTTSIALVTSFSRGGWLSTFIAVAFILIIKKKWSYVSLFGGVFALMLIILSIKFPHIILSALDRFGSIVNPFSEDSSSSRISLIKSGIWMWQDHPLLGVGAGGFRYHAFDYIDPNMPRVLTSVRDAHTLQAKILAEQGIIGFSIAMWLFATIFFDAIRNIKAMKEGYLKNVLIGFFSLFMGFVVNFTFASDLHNNVFWITIGVIYAIPIVYKNSLKNENAPLL